MGWKKSKKNKKKDVDPEQEPFGLTTEDKIGYGADQETVPSSEERSLTGSEQNRRASNDFESIIRLSLYEQEMRGNEPETAELLPGEGISTMAATINMIKQMMGAGVLAFAANAFQGGMLSCILLLPLGGGLSVYAAVLLVKTIEALEEKYPGLKIESFEDCAQAVFGRAGKIAMKIFFNITLFTIAILYVSIPADYMTRVLASSDAPLNQDWFWALIFSGMYIPLAWLNSLKIVSKFAVVGVGCFIIAMILIIVTAIRYWQAPADLVARDWPWISKTYTEDPNEPSPFTKFVGSFSTWAFGFGAILITPSTRNMMRDKSGLKTAVINSHIFVTCICLLMVIPCLLGFAMANQWSDNTVVLMNNPIIAPPQKADGTFWVFGEGEKNADGIPVTEDGQLNPFPTKSWEAWVTAFCTIVSVSITFPLIVRILTSFGEKSVPFLDSSIAVRLLWRTFLVCICIGIGLFLATMNWFGQTLGLIASLLMVPVQFMIPCIFYFVVKKQDAGSFGGAIKAVGIPNFAMMSFVLLAGLLFMIVGTMNSIKGFIN